MGIRLGNLWDRVSASYWFVPSLMMASCVALAYATITLDRDIDTNGFGWVYSGGPEGARKVLSTIAGSMITVAGAGQEWEATA